MKKITFLFTFLIMSTLIVGQEIQDGGFDLFDPGNSATAVCDGGRGYTGTDQNHDNGRRQDVPADGSWYRCGQGLTIESNQVVCVYDKSTPLRQTLTGLTARKYRITLKLKSSSEGVDNTKPVTISMKNIHDNQTAGLNGFSEAFGVTYDSNFVVNSNSVLVKPGAYDDSGYTTFKFDYTPQSTNQITLYLPNSDETESHNITNDPTLTTNYIAGQDPDVGESVFQSSSVLQIQKGRENSAGGTKNVYLDDVTMSAEVIWTGDTDTDWATPGNWSFGEVPTANDNVTIPTGTANSPIISATTGAVVNNITTNNVLTIASGGSLIVGGTSTGNVTYKANVNDTNWHLLSSPVEGESYDGSWITNNLIDDTTSTIKNIGIATYDNTTDPAGSWIYATDSNNQGNFNTAQGYSIKRDATGSDIAFTGTLKVDDASSIPITANDIGGAAENRWSLIGNPFPSYIKVSDLLLLTSNATALEDNREAVYISNGTTYEALTTGYIHPGQGFFVNSNLANTSIAINQDMLSHQTNVTFYKSATSNVSIVLKLTDGTVYKSTEVNYIADKTTGLDPGFDIGTFSASSDSFSIFSHLVSDNKGVHFMRQALPLDYENQIVPIGVSAKANKEITFSAESMNLPSGIKVFLEDRVHNTFTRLDEANATYKITLAEALNGVGRFYIHTTQSALSVDNVTLTGVSVFKANAAKLRVIGLTQGKASLSLFNVLGKQVMNTSFEATASKDISLPKLAKGIYFVKVQTATGELSKKIILE